MKRIAVLMATALFGTSCTYVASEMATRQSVAGTTTYVEAPLSRTAPLTAGYSFGLTLAGLALLQILPLPDYKSEAIRKLSYDCLARMPEEEKRRDEYLAANRCRAEAEIRQRRVARFWWVAENGKCKTGSAVINMFIDNCWNEAVGEIKEEFGDDWKSVLADILYDSAYMECMPDPLDYKTKEAQRELQDKYRKCLAEAEKGMKEKWAEIYPKVAGR